MASKNVPRSPHGMSCFFEGVPQIPLRPEGAARPAPIDDFLGFILQLSNQPRVSIWHWGDGPEGPPCAGEPLTGVNANYFISGRMGVPSIGVMLPSVYGGEFASKVITEGHSFFSLILNLPVCPPELSAITLRAGLAVCPPAVRGPGSMCPAAELLLTQHEACHDHAIQHRLLGLTGPLKCPEKVPE